MTHHKKIIMHHNFYFWHYLYALNMCIVDVGYTLDMFPRTLKGFAYVMCM